MDIDPCYYYMASDSNLLVVRMEGMWDLAVTTQFCQQFNQHILDNLQDDWALIADLRHWCLRSGDACEMLAHNHKESIELGLKYQGIILPVSSLKRWRIRAFVADDYTVSTLLAEDEQHVLSWLSDKGFRLSDLINPQNLIINQS